jgi:hypothetical protein
MSKTFGQTTLSDICEVRTQAGNTSTYFCKLTATYDGEQPEEIEYVARATDVAETGQWVYQQIVDGNFDGEIIDVPEGLDVFTGEPLVDFVPIDARKKRDLLLSSTDWTQNADIPQATKDKWVPYRQALRDVPQQSGFPHNIVWPTPPQ